MAAAKKAVKKAAKSKSIYHVAIDRSSPHHPSYFVYNEITGSKKYFDSLSLANSYIKSKNK